ncbi:MAG: SAM-dependent methyltransferase [Candidatus Moranbacteria bacterium CG_4_9_14_3_um_filter_42_9]|nr:MAG: SAM-dependent methyltransferase [Candidatus Moranbacteria bacterium CG_4_9_14_3_um_filter_42_9]
MPLSWNEIKSRAIEFSKEWESESSEHAEAKSFWDGFFNVFGVTRRRLANFEFEVEKRGGGRGFVDLFWPGTLIVEHKSRGKDLNKAHEQAMDYFPGLSNKDLPKYILVSDFERFRLYDIEEKTEVESKLKELNKKVHLFGFLAGYKKQEYKEEDEVNIKAAEMMGKLYDSMVEAGYSGHELNFLLVRILFCLFADDAGIFNQNQFKKYIETRTNEDGSDLGMHLGVIFQVLNTSKNKRQNTLDEELTQFEYVNGGLFSESLAIPALNSKMRNRLLEACEFNWSKISPAIFGSLFQSVKDRDARRQWGEHYTSEKNILKLIRPLFLDGLSEELSACGKNIQKLNAFHEKISNLKFLDPACGCGNFLIIAYRELRLLELELLKQRLGNMPLAFGVKSYIRIKPEQFFGIEIEEFPARIAQTAMWLMDHQMNELASLTFGNNVADLPLGKGVTIFIGNALQKDWEEVVPKNELSYIIGNPPFIGQHLQNSEQKKDMQNIFQGVKGFGVLDYVSCWYIKAAQYIKNTRIRCAFVSTNSITQGEQVSILWNELLKKYCIKIYFAHQTFKWSNEARGKAAVYCVIIGFANFDMDKKFLYEYEDIKGKPHEIKAKNINAYLIEGGDIVISSRTKAISKSPMLIWGNKPVDGGFLNFTDSEKKEFIEKEPQAEKFFRRYIGAEEFLHNKDRWCLWLKDANPEEIKKCPMVIEAISKVKDFRMASKKEATRKIAATPSLFGEDRQPDVDFILIPSTSSENRKYIPMGFVSKDIIVNNSCHIIPDATLYHLGILESEMHMVWVNHVCGRLESRFRYSKDIVYNNFPWPENPGAEKVKTVEKAAQAVLDAREKYPNNSLADLYGPLTMPAELVKAHQHLDRAVDAAYGRKTFANSAERMNYLFELYEKYTSPLISLAEKKSKKLKNG